MDTDGTVQKWGLDFEVWTMSELSLTTACAGMLFTYVIYLLYFFYTYEFIFFLLGFTCTVESPHDYENGNLYVAHLKLSSSYVNYNVWTISFDIQTSTEAGWDFLKIYTNDYSKTLLWENSGTATW